MSKMAMVGVWARGMRCIGREDRRSIVRFLHYAMLHGWRQAVLGPKTFGAPRGFAFRLRPVRCSAVHNNRAPSHWAEYLARSSRPAARRWRQVQELRWQGVRSEERRVGKESRSRG